jgi:transcriptional regulator with XRE-family HTH domain
MSFPQLIAATLVRRKLTQNAFGKLVGVGQGAVQKWISGERVPRRTLWPAIAKESGCTVDELFAAIDRSPPTPSSPTNPEVLAAERRVAEIKADLRRAEARVLKLRQRR